MQVKSRWTTGGSNVFSWILLVFGEAKKSDLQILQAIADWLSKMYDSSRIWLAFVTHEWLRYSKEPYCQAFFTSIA
ncbi:hypothetical protein EDC04DRAFT_2679708 [Pisolithus marmoratus]|nr:hypothetical protein EDC04DRAFT_2679708 [Pisolithus marmoratus]